MKYLVSCEDKSYCIVLQEELTFNENDPSGYLHIKKSDEISFHFEGFGNFIFKGVVVEISENQEFLQKMMNRLVKENGKKVKPAAELKKRDVSKKRTVINKEKKQPEKKNTKTADSRSKKPKRKEHDGMEEKLMNDIAENEINLVHQVEIHDLTQSKDAGMLKEQISRESIDLTRVKKEYDSQERMMVNEIKAEGIESPKEPSTLHAKEETSTNLVVEERLEMLRKSIYKLVGVVLESTENIFTELDTFKSNMSTKSMLRDQSLHSPVPNFVTVDHESKKVAASSTANRFSDNFLKFAEKRKQSKSSDSDVEFEPNKKTRRINYYSDKENF